MIAINMEVVGGSVDLWGYGVCLGGHAVRDIAIIRKRARQRPSGSLSPRECQLRCKDPGCESARPAG
jgi:hypothetical protein